MELKDGVWLEPIQALLRRRTNRNVMRKLVVRVGRVQKRLYDVGWSDEKKCRSCTKEGGTEKHRLYHSASWREAGNQIPEGLGKWEHRARTSKED